MSKQGSKEVVQFHISHTQENLQLLKTMGDELKKQGWQWFKDYYWSNGTANKIQVSIYKQELVPIIKGYLVEKLI
jgi:hypothetical protein